MKSQKAIVTIAIGDRYYTNWKRFCEPSWKRYADRFGFDVICLQEPLDHSERARARSAAWQKCLILSPEIAREYGRVVWVDSDIMINACAPDITVGVPIEKLGVVEDQSFPHPAYLKRVFQLWPEGAAVVNYTPREYYSKYGMPNDCDRVFNSGVLVLSPAHRTVLEHVYYHYEEKDGGDGGRKWHMEQRPLSYEAVRSGMVHWMDPRFNVMLPIERYATYPFLQPRHRIHSPRNLRERIERKLRTVQTTVNSKLLRRLNTDAVNTIFQASYFLHFGSDFDQMASVRQRPTVWWDVLH